MPSKQGLSRMSAKQFVQFNRHHKKKLFVSQMCDSVDELILES